MVKVTFKSLAGDKVSVVEAELGKSLMAAAKNNRVEGIEAICGGSMACGTCHVYIDPDWYHRLLPPSAAESEVIEFSYEPRSTSRLSCQVLVTAELNGLCVTVPEAQL